LGAESSRVFSIGNTVETQFFEEITSKLRASKSTEERKHLTYIGYLNPRKNVQALLLVVKELSILREDFVLDIVGDGESRKNLETLVAENKLEKFVVFHGFKQKEELPEYLAVSNCFLFQTDFDIWGLVLNEAMASGVPCLASINAGATEDLIKEGQTGFKIDFNNSIHVAKQIDFILNQPSKMKEVSKNASVFIQKNYSLSNCAKRMMSAVYNEI
jgi:glycosyltransferase involved in cell wall biosynthesis